MNKRQKEVIQASLDDEKTVLKNLEKNYTTALADVKKNIRELQANPLTQSKAYQLEFQKQLEKQISGIIDTLQGNNFISVADYLNTCYNQGFIGTMYDLHGQGVPIITPINQKQVLKSVQKTGDDIKLANKLGVSTSKLKQQILSELQRGLATELPYSDIARNISNWGQADINRSMTIARTEGHRVQNEAKVDCFNSAKDKGADIVKQWDATLDGATRENHRKLDGQIVELDEDFSVDGMSAPYPGGFGDPAEDCNCRCCMLQRARWALDDDELSTLQERAEYFGLDKTDNFEDFKEKYLNLPDNADTIDIEPSEIRKELQKSKIEYREVKPLDRTLSEAEIIEKLGGGDMTEGSCASLALAYIGNKNGYDVTDYRGGESRKFFSMKTRKLLDLPNVKGSIMKFKNEAVETAEMLKGLEQNKEYLLSAGKHAAIVRNIGKGLEYLELQSKYQNGWISFDEYGSTVATLIKRFKCRKTVDKMKFGSETVIFEKEVVLMEVDSFAKNEEFSKILGYLNTATYKQKKGALGNAK